MFVSVYCVSEDVVIVNDDGDLGRHTRQGCGKTGRGNGGIVVAADGVGGT